MRGLSAVLLVLLCGACASGAPPRPMASAAPAAAPGSGSLAVPLARTRERIEQRRHVCNSGGVRANRGGWC